MRLIKSAMNKVCSNIEQKGVAQLLQIKEVRCGSNLPEGVVLVNHHMHKELVFF